RLQTKTKTKQTYNKKARVKPRFLLFIVVLYNGEGIKQEVIQANTEIGVDNLLEFCKIPRTRKEIAQFLGLDTVFYVSKKYIDPLVAEGKLEMTIPDKPSSRKQKYVLKS
ncbi:MAG: hypothetical protein IIW67_03730, partial [Peptococcaceae bacterium]|nr:hypothetical protein [Peptococcaceae bacterium]